MVGNGRKWFVIEPHSPYFFTHQKDPTSSLAVVFDEKNYDLWERAVRTALKAKNKLGLIDKTLSRLEPKEGEEFLEADAWDMANSMLCLWLANVIDSKLRISIAYSDIAKITWDDMKKHYTLANTKKIHQLIANISNCNQSDLHVDVFYSK